MKVGNLPIAMGDYKGLTLSSIDIATSEEAVQARMEELLGLVVKPQIVEGPIRKGDTVTISYQGHVGKKSFPGSSCEDCSVVIGSGTFFEGFESRLLGHRLGDEFDFSVNFPSAHINQVLEGRLARFSVKVKSVVRPPESLVSDEVIREFSEFSGVDEFRQAIWDQMEAENADEMARYLRGCARSALAEIADVDVPEPMLREVVENSVEELRESLDAQGISFDRHLSKMGKDEEGFIEDIRNEARKGMVVSRALIEIARLEGIVVSAEDFDREIDLLAASADVPVEEVREALNHDEFRDLMHDSILQDKALAIVLEHAVLTGEEVF